MFNSEINVSVVMAVKNESKYIQEAIESILNQRIALELIVVDDNSTDRTYEIAERAKSSNNKLKLFKSNGHGKVAAFNLGVSKACGSFICLFAGDDIMPKDSLSLRLDMIKDLDDQYPVAGLSKIRIMSEDKKKDGLIVPKRKGQGSLSGQSPLMNRKAVDILFPIPNELPNEDTWLEIALGHTNLIKIVHSDILCCFWRMHEGNSVSMKTPYKDFKNKLIRRRKAYKLFLDFFKTNLSYQELELLKNMVEGVNYYENENLVGLLSTKTNFKWKIRMISTINPFFYKIRTTFYNLLTGW